MDSSDDCQVALMKGYALLPTEAANDKSEIQSVAKHNWADWSSRQDELANARARSSERQ